MVERLETLNLAKDYTPCARGRREQPGVQRKGFPEREDGRETASAKPSKPRRSGSRSALRRTSRARSIQHKSCTGRTGKLADRQAGRMSGMQAVGCSSTVPTRATDRCRLAFGSAGRTGFNAGVRHVKYAGVQTGKPLHGPEGIRPRLRAGQKSALTPRRSILAAGILKKHEGFGGVLQLPAHPI